MPIMGPPLHGGAGSYHHLASILAQLGPRGVGRHPGLMEGDGPRVSPGPGLHMVLVLMMDMSTATMTHSEQTVAPPPAVRGQGHNLDKNGGNQVNCPLMGPPLTLT